MFTAILNAMSICLQGTVFQRRSKKHSAEKHRDAHAEHEADSHPYLLIADEYKLKNDLITKAQHVDNRLQHAREGAKRGQAKWFNGTTEQAYKSPHAHSGSPQIELYYKNLPLTVGRDPRTTFSNVAR